MRGRSCRSEQGLRGGGWRRGQLTKEGGLEEDLEDGSLEDDGLEEDGGLEDDGIEEEGDPKEEGDLEVNLEDASRKRAAVGSVFAGVSRGGR